MNAESAAKLGTWFVVVQFNTRNDADEFIEDHLQDEPFTVEYEPSNIERHAAKPVNTESAAKLVSAAKNADWQQVVLNGGPPCFHLEETGTLCLRAERWEGHCNGDWPHHKYIPLHEIITTLIERHATPQPINPLEFGCADVRPNTVDATPQTQAQTGWMIEFTPMPKPLWYTGGLHKRQEPYATNNAIEAKRLRLDNLWGSKTFTPNFTDDPCKAAVYLTEGAAKSVLAELHASGKLMGEDCYIVTEHEWPSTSQTQATHGEGEAALQWRWRTHEHAGPWNDGLPPEGEEAKRGGYKDWIEYWFVGALHVIEQSLRSAAPSPTAAPALGELAKRLLAHADYLDRETRLQRSENLPPHKLAMINQDSDMDGYSYAEQKMREAMHDMRTAAAALSGFAAGAQS